MGVNVITWVIVETMQLKDEPCFADTLVDILPDARLIAELWVRNIVIANLGASWDKTCSSSTDECPLEREKRDDETPCVTIGKACTEDQCCKLREDTAIERSEAEMNSKGDRIIPERRQEPEEQETPERKEGGKK